MYACGALRRVSYEMHPRLVIHRPGESLVQKMWNLEDREEYADH